VPDDIAWQIVEEATVNMEGPIGKYRWEYAGSELEADTHVLSLPRSCAATLDVVKLLVTQAKRTGMSSIANSPNHFSVARRSCRLDSRDEHGITSSHSGCLRLNSCIRPRTVSNGASITSAAPIKAPILVPQITSPRAVAGGGAMAPVHKV
jgi:hypothetical protein